MRLSCFSVFIILILSRPMLHLDYFCKEEIIATVRGVFESGVIEEKDSGPLRSDPLKEL